jgi:hypothetical protein
MFGLIIAFISVLLVIALGFFIAFYDRPKKTAH